MDVMEYLADDVVMVTRRYLKVYHSRRNDLDTLERYHQTIEELFKAAGKGADVLVKLESDLALYACGVYARPCQTQG